MQDSAQEAGGGTPLLTACVTEEVCRYQSPLRHKNDLREGESSVGISRKVPLIPSRFQSSKQQTRSCFCKPSSTVCPKEDGCVDAI